MKIRIKYISKSKSPKYRTVEATEKTKKSPKKKSKKDSPEEETDEESEEVYIRGDAELTEDEKKKLIEQRRLKRKNSTTMQNAEIQSTVSLRPEEGDFLL